MTEPLPLPVAKAPRRRGDLTRQAWNSASHGLVTLFGGTARTRVILVLGGVLALNSADTATVGASAIELRQGLHISNADIGLLVAVTAVVVAIFSVPFGIVVDRANRIAILTVTVGAWGLIMLASAAVGNFSQLLLARLVLGAATAASGPGVASLVGDYFPSDERGKIYGYVLAGELLGAGAGFVISGDAADISWRAAFIILAIPTAPLAWALGHLHEPARGGASQLVPGATRLISRREVGRRAGPVDGDAKARPGDEGLDAAGASRPSSPGATGPPDGNGVRWVRASAMGGAGAASASATGGAASATTTGEPEPDRPTDAQEVARKRGIKPDPRLILRRDPRRMGLITMMRYVLAVRTNRILILSSACGYFFLTGVETFGLEFVRKQYDVSQILANLFMLVVGAGAVFGVLLGGRLGDNLVKRGRLTGRLVVAGVAAVATTVLFIPALVTHSIFTALPYIAFAGFFLTAQNPPIDAARLDVMPPLLWGRAEGVRSFLRTAAQALAPLSFGGLADLVGLRTTFAVMLVPFLGSALILFLGLRTYPTDVATAAASAAAKD